MLGGDIAFEGGSSAGLSGGDSQRFSGRGTVTAEALRQAPELGTLARMAAALSGQTQYRATLTFVNGRPQISVASNLVGVAIDLPAPLAKAAATPLALRFRTGPEDGATPPPDSSAPIRETLQVDLGGGLQANFVREASGETTRVVRGAMRVGEARTASADRTVEPTPLDPIEAPALPAQGVAAHVALKRLDVEAWQAALARMQGDGARPGAAAAAPLVFDASGGAGYVPDAIALRVGELVFGARRLGNVTAGLSQQGELWRANVSADELDGYVEYRPARRGSTGAGRLYGRFARLSLPKGEVERVEGLLDAQPATIPALDIVVDDFELRGRRLGRLEIEATNRAGERGCGREWQLAKLNLTMPEAQLSASGTWGDAGASAANPARRADDELQPRPRRQRRLARAARHGPRRPRRQGLARRRRLVAGIAVLARLREDDRPGQGRDRLGPVPEGGPGRGAPAQRPQPAVAAAPALVRLSRSVQRGLRIRQRRRRRQDRPRPGVDQQPAHARSRRGRADGGQRRPRARDRGPARRRRPRDQRRHGVARLCGDQSGDRPRHLPRPVLPEKAADGGEHARVPRHRTVGRSEGRARRAQPGRRGRCRSGADGRAGSATVAR